MLPSGLRRSHRRVPRREEGFPSAPARRLRAARLLALAAVGPAAPAAGQVGGGPPPDEFSRGGHPVHYAIDARLDGETKQIEASERIRWTNASDEAVADLWFHVYLNAFSNNRSTHLTEADGKLRGHLLEDGWGWSQVRAVRLLGEDGDAVDLFPTFRYRQPDDAREDDRTVFSVDLPREVGPGETIDVQVDWVSQLPRVRRRTGYKGDFLLVAQWFPKLAVYEAGRGWNAHQFHMNSEWYADYGTYDVTLDLPAEYKDKVFGSGVVESSVLRGDRVEVTLAAPSRADRRRPDAFGKIPVVHDFAWTADPRFEVKSYLFEFEEWAARYPEEVEFAREALGPGEPIELRDVHVTVLIHPERADQAERHREATEAALFFYGLWFGEYPFEHVAAVDPPWGGRAAAGMEYPTIFTCGTRLSTTPDMHVPESVTVHECGHQFFYLLLGNNEFEAAWLDEGFNSFADAEVLMRVWGPKRATTTYAGVPVAGVPRVPPPGGEGLADVLAGRRIPLPLLPDLEPLPASGFVDWWRDQPRLAFSPELTDPRWADRSNYLRRPPSDPIDTVSWEHVDRSSYVGNSYPGTAVSLRTLRDLVGPEAFLRGMRHYATNWRYRHPYPDDFFRAFERGSGAGEGGLAWFFEDVFRSTARGDWSIGVEQERRPRPMGFFQSGTGEFVELESPVDTEGTDDRPWSVDLVLRREGDLTLPVTVRLTYEDGETEDFPWTRAEQLEKRWLRREFETQRKLVSAEIDPDGRVWLDVNVSNNRWFEERERVAPKRWFERVFSRWSHLLFWYAGLGG